MSGSSAGTTSPGELEETIAKPSFLLACCPHLCTFHSCSLFYLPSEFHDCCDAMVCYKQRQFWALPGLQSDKPFDLEESYGVRSQGPPSKHHHRKEDVCLARSRENFLNLRSNVYSLRQCEAMSDWNGHLRYVGLPSLPFFNDSLSGL